MGWQKPERALYFIEHYFKRMPTEKKFMASEAPLVNDPEWHPCLRERVVVILENVRRTPAPTPSKLPAIGPKLNG